MKRHVYIVTEVNPDHPAVSHNNLTVGSKLILRWYGKTHDLQTESEGQVDYLCSIAHVSRYEEES